MRSLLSRLSIAVSRSRVNREKADTDPDMSQSTTISGRGGRGGAVTMENGTPPVPVARRSVPLMLTRLGRAAAWLASIRARCCASGPTAAAICRN